MNALENQIGGNHYTRLKIQPGLFCQVNGITLLEGNVIKYISRFRFKNGVEDVKKAKHCVELIRDIEEQWSIVEEVDIPMDFAITPEEYCLENDLTGLEKDAIILICRFREEGNRGLNKVIKIIDKIIKMEELCS